MTTQTTESGTARAPIAAVPGSVLVTAANGTRWHRPASEASRHLAAGRIVEWVDGWEFLLPTKWAVR